MPLDDAALNLLFRDARTHNKWTDQPVTDDDLRAVFDLLKMAPTSANCSPARFLFLRTQEAKEKLRPALSAGNVDKTMAAPVTVIVEMGHHDVGRFDVAMQQALLVGIIQRAGDPADDTSNFLDRHPRRIPIS